MKKYFLFKVLTTSLFLFFLVFNMNGQEKPWENPDYGPDSTTRVECAYQLSTLNEYMKINLYQYAFPAWKWVYENCPASSLNIYISGAKIYSNKIENAESPEMKQAYLDTLMMIYDKRIKYFGDEGYVFGKKGIDIIKYNEKEYDKAYEAFKRSAEIDGVETSLNVLTGLIQTSAFMLKSGKIDDQKFLKDYVTITQILEKQMDGGKSIPRIKRASKMVESIVSKAGIKDCDAIESVFTELLQEAGEDPEFLELAIDICISAGCDNTLFFSDINEKLMEVNPDPKKAYEVAKFNIKNNNFEKAVEFLDKAIEFETDNERKATYQFQLAVLYNNKLNNQQAAVKYAKQAVENKTGWGDPYFIIAQAYISGIRECTDESFKRQAVYWLAVDYCRKAKSVDPSVTEKANELIGQYKANYPSMEEAFFRSLSEGDEYSFDCWINETTTVKSK